MSDEGTLGDVLACFCATPPADDDDDEEPAESPVAVDAAVAVCGSVVVMGTAAAAAAAPVVWSDAALTGVFLTRELWGCNTKPPRRCLLAASTAGSRLSPLLSSLALLLLHLLLLALGVK